MNTLLIIDVPEPPTPVKDLPAFDCPRCNGTGRDYWLECVEIAGAVTVTDVTPMACHLCAGTGLVSFDPQGSPF